MSANTYFAAAPITHQQDIFPQPITALSFDPVSDVLWAGSNLGIVSAYNGSRLRGVAFSVGSGLRVQKIVAGDQQVQALGAQSNNIGSWSKGGANKWQSRYEGHRQLTSGR